MKCLSEHDYNHDVCKTVFANYVFCRKFWVSIVEVDCFWSLNSLNLLTTFNHIFFQTAVQKDRKIKGLYPLLPKPEDREEIKRQYVSANPNGPDGW